MRSGPGIGIAVAMLLFAGSAVAAEVTSDKRHFRVSYPDSWLLLGDLETTGIVRIGTSDTHLGRQGNNRGPLIMVFPLKPGADEASRRADIEKFGPVRVSGKPGELQVEREDEERKRHRVWRFPRPQGRGFNVALEYDQGDSRAAEYESVLREVAASVVSDAAWPEMERAERERVVRASNGDLARQLWQVSGSSSPPFALVNPFAIALIDVHALDRDAMLRCDADQALNVGLRTVGAVTAGILRAEGALQLNVERYVFVDVDPREAIRRAVRAALQVAAASAALTSSFCPPDTNFSSITIHMLTGFGADPEAPPTIEGDPVGELRELVELRRDGYGAVVVSRAALADLGDAFTLGRRVTRATHREGDDPIAGAEVLGAGR